MTPNARIGLIALGLLLGGPAARRSVQAFARRSLPQTDGTVSLRCLDRPVEVIRDRFGIPHISASGLSDLARAQGFVHAQDRLFQMEMIRRFARGRLSEIAGSRTLELDRFVRRLRLRWVAEQEAAMAAEEVGALADAYAQGVNEWLARSPLPLELRLARVRPEPWDRTDVFLPGKVLALGLSVNWESELVRMRLAARLGADRVAHLDPAYPEELPVIVPARLAVEGERRARWLRRLLGGGGSNSWVVSGSRSENGKPLLANDPHLSLVLPALWHVQHLTWDEETVAGFTFPGAPLVVLGRNARVAWGFTAANVDTQDLYVERFDPATGRYESDGDWIPAEVVHEEIRVRGQAQPVVEEVLLTRHGPVVAGPEPGSNEALALRWSSLEPGDTLGAVLDLARSRTAEDVEHALDRFAGPPQNVVFADADGAIGYRLAGGPIPRRPPGAGFVPMPGWDSRYDWEGWIPPRELPRLRDPAQGFIVTANNRIAGDDYPYFLGSEYMNGYRASRIETLLAERERVGVDDCRRIQLDLLSLPGLALGEIARGFRSDDPLEQHALDLLAAWDGVYGPESAAGAVYGVLMRTLQRDVYSEVGEELPYFLGAGQTEAAAGMGLFERTRPMILRMLADRDDSFFADDRTWESVFRAALAVTVRELGPDPAAWRWGNLHRVVFEHPFDQVPLLGRSFNRGPYPVGGDTDTVWQMAWPVDRPYGPHLFGPSMRAVFDLASPDGNHVVLSTGQSGHVASPHYDDFIPRWLAGELVALVMTRERVLELAKSRLWLVPGPVRATRQM